MKEEIIEGDLYIHGNLNCGKDGILEADGSVSYQWKDATTEKRKEKFSEMPEEDFELEGRKIIVHGNVFVWGTIYFDLKTWGGHVTAAMAAE